jgi:hypothetical protein
MIEYITIGVILAVIALLAGWMFVTSHVHYSLKLIATAIIVGLSIYNWTLFTSIMAYPINDLPPDGVTIITMIPLKAKGVDYLWVTDPNDLKHGPKGYAIPHHDHEARRIQQALEQARVQGGSVIYHRPKGKGKGKDGEGEGEGEGNGKAGGAKGNVTGKDSTEFGDDSEGSNVTTKTNIDPKHNGIYDQDQNQ